jgi:ABC transporter substrate binding protein
MSADELFFQGLRNFGWTEGQNILIERRFAGANANQLRDSAAELVRLKVDVIVAVASAGTLAAKDATTSIPIVFVNAGDPVGQGFVQSLAHPAAAIDKRIQAWHRSCEESRRLEEIRGRKKAMSTSSLCAAICSSISRSSTLEKPPVTATVMPG